VRISGGIVETGQSALHIGFSKIRQLPETELLPFISRQPRSFTPMSAGRVVWPIAGNAQARQLKTKTLCKMKVKLLTIPVICFSLFVQAQKPRVEWVKSIGGKGNDRANTITADREGNSIVAGRFQSPTIRIDNLLLTKSISDSAGLSDIFILKLDKKGKTLWAVTAGGFGDDHALSCVTDKKGNIYVVGYFESQTLSFGNISLKNNNFTAGKDSIRYNSDMWVAKFTPQGKCVWAKNAGGLDGNGQYSTITLDNQNNVVISGIAGGEMNFGNGTKLTRATTGMYVAKYTNDGKLIWAKSPDGKGEAQGVSTDEAGNIFIAGYFTSTIFFDDIVLTSFSDKSPDAFVAKYSPSGHAIWARNFGGDNTEIASCETDPKGSTYLAGLFSSKTIATGVDTLKNNGSVNHFIARYDETGKLLWAKSAGGNNGDAPGTATREFHVDDKGNAFCTGSNWSEFTFAGQKIKPVANSEDIVLLKYDKDGKEVWGVDYGGAGRNAGRGVCTDQEGNIFLTGSFDEKQLKMEGLILLNQGQSDIFIAKFSE
jgi:hypothetical protein